jgi:ATP-dependent DNA helicase RecG
MGTSLKLDLPLDAISGIGPRFTAKLKRLGIVTVKDLLWHFPSRYEDFTKIYQIGELEPGQQATVQGVVEDVNVRRTWHKHLTIVEASISDGSGAIRAVWFNQPYIKNLLRPGRMANFSGKVAFSEQELYLSHPTYELTSAEVETKHTARLVPVYPETRGLTSKGIRFIMKPILDNLETLKEWIPKEILKTAGLPDINMALTSIHFPDDLTDALYAKRRFAFENLFLLQMLNFKQKMKLAQEKAPKIPTDIAWLKQTLEKMPFELTHTQKRSLWEVIQNMDKARPMNRLLQGDVGSGKTVVAALSALIAHKNGLQTAIMAPTEVLAHQHYETFKKLFASIPAEDQAVLGLITSGESKIFYENDVETETKKPALLKKIEEGQIGITIGTHALISKTKGSALAFKKLGLVVIDEQHRFGVEQRAELLRHSGVKKLIPHFLSMSATPIPRTLMLTIFGDLDISAITELPAGRKEIVTKVVMPLERRITYEFIREKVKEGRQVFVICPRIEPSDEEEVKIPSAFKKLELKSVKEEFEKLSKNIFPDLKVAMLHGQMKPKEKGKIMSAFKNKATDVLVCTSVIEVGVDVPNAAIMMIEGADRFGLAQLYQFRGRVGRGEHQSYCFLFTDSESKDTQARLQAILTAKNGFELAEKDLAIRGPGEFLGTEQTGLPDIAMENLQNVELVRGTRTAAAQVLKKSPTLAAFPMLKNKLGEFERRIHLE